MVRRSFTSSQLRIVAARQQWLCSGCDTTLPAAYEVDHTRALADGGADALDNATAMCSNCHARKTLAERVARDATRAAAAYTKDHETRTDIVLPGGKSVRCALCWQVRPIGQLQAHTFCQAIEAKHFPRQTLAELSLEQFRFIPTQHARHQAQGSTST